MKTKLSKILTYVATLATCLLLVVGTAIFATGCSKKTPKSPSNTKNEQTDNNTQNPDDNGPTKIFSFKLNESGDGYEIVEYKGSSLVVEIPATYLEKPITAIGESAFAGKPVEQITFAEGSQLTKIKDNAFSGSSSFTITMESITPPSLDSYALYDVVAIYVPAEALETYKSADADGWSKYADKIFAIE